MDPMPNGSNVSLCPAEKMMADQTRLDLSRGYIPILLATALFAGGFGIAFRVGGWMETFKQERSAVLTRLDTIEGKLDRIIASAGPQLRAKR